MHLVVLREHVSGINGMFLAVRVVEIDGTRCNRANQEARMRVPAAVTTRRKRQLLHIEIGGSLRLELKLPRRRAVVRIARHLNLLADTVRSGAHRQDLIDKKTERRSCQRHCYDTEHAQHENLPQSPATSRVVQW